MYDRPSATELIEAARQHLESAVVPAVRADRKLYFQTLVAINVMKIVERELDLGAEHAQAEWQRLDAIVGEAKMPARLPDIKAALTERNAALSAAIRTGEYDDGDRKQALFDHLQASTVEQLVVANPRLLEKMQQEMKNADLDAWEGR